jgi:hypothetical protein
VQTRCCRRHGYRKIAKLLRSTAADPQGQLGRANIRSACPGLARSSALP